LNNHTGFKVVKGVIPSFVFDDLLFVTTQKVGKKVSAAGKGCHTPYGVRNDVLE